MTKRIVFLLGLLFAAQAAFALTIAPPTGHVNDRAGMLDTATVRRLESFLTDFERSDSTQIVILIVPNLAGQPLESFSLAVAQQWGIGQKGKDNGALLFIAKDERRIRIEVGYGLEGRLTDLIAGRIIRDAITPAFRQGNFDLGVTRGAEAMVSAVKGEYKAGGSAVPDNNESVFGYYAILLIFGLFIIARILGPLKPLAVMAGGGFTFLLGSTVFGFGGGILLLVTVVGALAGLLASVVLMWGIDHDKHSGWRHGSGGVFRCGDDGFSISSGDGNGASGGFGGGGGGFGGGGASGGW